MMLKQLDHLVLTVSDIDTSIEFYTRVLGMEAVSFGDNRKALKFGEQKINLHQSENEFEPKAKTPCKGSADLCFLLDIKLDKFCRHLEQQGIVVEQGPIQRTGATGPILSVYIRDPDGNLLELSEPLPE
ncbi:MAG: VOC family protein [Gammaproteobacteria bacterium]